MKERLAWLTDIAVLVRALALLVAAIAGAVIERDVGVLPPADPVSGSSSKLLAEPAVCPPRP